VDLICNFSSVVPLARVTSFYLMKALKETTSIKNAN